MKDFVLARGGQVCRLCIAPDAPATAPAAAGELARCLAAQCGQVPPIIQGTPRVGDVCLGGRSADCAEEELRLRVDGGILWLDGGRRGLLYAAYELLERLGCRFFAADCELLPAAEQLLLPGDTDVRQTPVFEYRDAYWYGVTPDFAPRLRLNAVLQDGKDIPAALGGSVRYNGFVHTLGALAELEKDEEGTYTDRQPCLSKEETFQTVLKNLRQNLAADPGARIASVSQNDSHDWDRGCQCPACRAKNEAEGGAMGSLLPFVDRVAEAIAPEYPDLAIDTLAYRYTRKAPATLKARDNVIVRLCSIECCFAHPIESCADAMLPVEDAGFADTLRQWADHCERIYIWDYTTNFRCYNGPFPNFGVLRQNLRFFAQNKVRGVFEQGNSQSPNGEFGPLRTYLLGKLLWDPLMSEETYQRHIDEFLAGYYGPGAPALRRYLDRLQAAAQKVHFGIYFEDPVALFTDPARKQRDLVGARRFLQAGRQDFVRARALASPVQRTRIGRAEVQLDIYEWYLCRAQRDALPEGDPRRAEAAAALRTAGRALYAHALAYGIRYMHESFVGGDYCFANDTCAPDTDPAYWGK